MVPARHTSALFISGFRSTTMRLLRRFRRAGSSGGEWPLPPEGTALGTAAPRSSTPSTTPSGCWTTTQRGYHCCRSGCQDMLRRHVVAPGVLSLCMHFSTSFLVNTSGRAQGCCCGGVLRGQRGHHCWRSYWCSQAFKTHATISPFRPLSWSFFFCRSPCCVVSSVLSPKQQRFCLFTPPLVGLSVMNKGTDFYVSWLRVCCSMVLSFTLPRSAAFRVFCIASSLYSSLADFCSGERRLFLSLRRRNHLVSDVDRRETGLFPRKTKTSLPGCFFF